MLAGTMLGTLPAHPGNPLRISAVGQNSTEMSEDGLLADTMPFAATLRIRTVEAGPEQVTARLGWDPSLCTSGGVLHGGAVMTLADSAGAACAFLNLPEGATGTTTIESKTNFLRVVREGEVEARARPLHRGGSFIVVVTDVSDAEGRLVARVTQTQAVLRPRG